MERAIPVLPANDLHVAREFYVDAEERGVGARTFDVIDPFGNTIFVVGPTH